MFPLFNIHPDNYHSLIIKIEELFINNDIVPDGADKINLLWAKNQNMKKFISDLLADKAQALLDVVSPKEEHFLLRKYFKTLIALDNEDILHSLETHYACDPRIEGFIIFIDELIKANKDVNSYVQTFFSILKINNIPIINIDAFLKAIGKDKTYLIQELVSRELFDECAYYINNVLSKDLADAQIITETIKSLRSKIEYEDLYIDFICSIMSYYKESCSLFLDNENILLDNIEERLLTSGNLPIPNIVQSVKYYCEFISHNKERFLNFEKKFLQTQSQYYILRFAKEVEISSKKLILKRLLEFKNETYVIEFLKFFPKYGHLLPLI